MYVYAQGSNLVSKVSNTKAITSTGTIIDLDTTNLKSAALLSGGIYKSAFIQAAIGGLVAPPAYAKAGFVAYMGKVANVLVEPIDATTVRYAAGLPDSAFVLEKPNKINKGKSPDLDKDMPGDGRMGNGPGGPNQKSPMEDIAEMDAMGNDQLEPEVPETLSIADDTELSNVKSLVIKWDNPVLNGSIEDIKNLFGEGSILPEPTSMVIDTGAETISSKKKAAIKSTNKKQADYTMSGTMTKSCGELDKDGVPCGGMLMYSRNPETGDVELECAVCNHKYRYEGSKPGQGVSGQTKV
jgi:hypothetical protein